MSKNLIRTALVFTAFLCVTAFAVFGNSVFADNAKHWVSVDAAELNTVAASVEQGEGRQALNAGVTRVIDGIAVLRLDEQQMEELSRGMHENFHKCGGFVRHASESEAISWIERMRSVDRETPSVVYTIDNQAAVNTLMATAREIDTRQVIIDLSAFPNRRYNQPSGLESANWIKNRWTQLGLFRSDVTVEFFNHPTNVSPQPSVILTIRGTTLPDEVVVLGAHQDSINGAGQTASAPGADDDASGIACLTETIRVLMAKNFKPQRTVKFMAYAAEEVGLRGSAAIATAFRNANTNVVGVMQLDMTNYKGNPGFDVAIITDFTTAAQNQFIRDLLATYQPTLVVGNSQCGYSCSDHASWYNRSYPVSFPFEAPIGTDNPWIHTSTDTILRSNNNADHALKFAKLGLSYVGELAKGCLSSRRIPCNAATPERPMRTQLKLTSAVRENSGSLLMDAMSF